MTCYKKPVTPLNKRKRGELVKRTTDVKILQHEYVCGDLLKNVGTGGLWILGPTLNLPLFSICKQDAKDGKNYFLCIFRNTFHEVNWNGKDCWELKDRIEAALRQSLAISICGIHEIRLETSSKQVMDSWEMPTISVEQIALDVAGMCEFCTPK